MNRGTYDEHLWPTIQALIEERARLGLSQRETAELTGTGQSHLCAWEQGRVAPTVWYLRRWADALGLDLEITLYRRKKVRP